MIRKLTEKNFQMSKEENWKEKMSLGAESGAKEQIGKPLWRSTLSPYSKYTYCSKVMKPDNISHLDFKIAMDQWLLGTHISLFSFRMVVCIEFILSL